MANWIISRMAVLAALASATVFAVSGQAAQVSADDSGKAKVTQIIFVDGDPTGVLVDAENAQRPIEPVYVAPQLQLPDPAAEPDVYNAQQQAFLTIRGAYEQALDGIQEFGLPTPDPADAPVYTFMYVDGQACWSLAGIASPATSCMPMADQPQ